MGGALSVVRLIEERAPPVLIVGLFHTHLMTYNVDYMTRADGNFCAYYSKINVDNCFQGGKL